MHAYGSLDACVWQPRVPTYSSIMPQAASAGGLKLLVNTHTHTHTQVVQLGMHPYGCRVIQRILEHCPHAQVAGMLQDIVMRCRELVLDQ